jgi:hypothetical protein
MLEHGDRDGVWMQIRCAIIELQAPRQVHSVFSKKLIRIPVAAG